MKKLSITIRAWAVLALLPLHTAASQEIASIRVGESVRLSVASPTNSRVEGKLVFLSPDSIQLSGKSNPAPISLSDIKLIEVKRRTGASFRRSILLGLLGGVVTGFVSGMVSGDTNTGDGRITNGDKAVIGSVVLGAVGLIGGTIFGACCSSSWVPVTDANRR